MAGEEQRRCPERCARNGLHHSILQAAFGLNLRLFSG
jgi:hypothetical protein